MPTSIKSSQSGFGILELLLIVLMAGIIGGTGYYVWRSYNQTNNSLKAVASSTNQLIKRKTTSSTTATTVKPVATASTDQYLVIKEWGVRMKLSPELADAYYAFAPNETTSAYLSTKSLVAVAPSCAPLATSIGAIYRQTEAEYQAASQASSGDNPPGNIKIGKYHYGFLGTQAGCFDSSNTAAQKIMNAQQPRAGFVTAEKTLEAVPSS